MIYIRNNKINSAFKFKGELILTDDIFDQDDLFMSSVGESIAKDIDSNIINNLYLEQCVFIDTYEKFQYKIKTIIDKYHDSLLIKENIKNIKIKFIKFIEHDYEVMAIIPTSYKEIHFKYDPSFIDELINIGILQSTDGEIYTINHSRFDNEKIIYIINSVT